MTLIATLRGIGLARDINQEAAIYAAPPADMATFQLARFNAGWTDSLARSPWARAMAARLALPQSFASWDDLATRVPVQTKADLRLDLADPATANEPVSWRATGGTTAEPLRFPVFRSEARDAGIDQWLGRGRLDVTPSDRLFMIWGHAHMFGTGLKGTINRLKRQLSDAVIGYTRWSAYSMSPADLRLAGDALAESGARYVIGYSSALDRFARANADRSSAFRGLNLKAVIATAEGFPREDSRAVIEACFGCPVVMEYGSVETGAIAYERPAGGYDVFWARHRIELGEATPAGRTLIVTSLNARALPLLRYAIGDVANAGGTDGVTGFDAVGGRVNDAITLPNGTPIHSEAFTHVMRDLPGVRVYQIVGRKGGGVPTIRYEAEAPLAEASLSLLKKRLALIDEVLRDTPVERVEEIPLSGAGKHRMVIEES